MSRCPTASQVAHRSPSSRKVWFWARPGEQLKLKIAKATVMCRHFLLLDAKFASWRMKPYTDWDHLEDVCKVVWFRNSMIHLQIWLSERLLKNVRCQGAHILSKINFLRNFSPLWQFVNGTLVGRAACCWSLGGLAGKPRSASRACPGVTCRRSLFF